MVNCEKCGSEMVERNGPKGSFLGCSKYPECKNTSQLKPSENKTFAKAPAVDNVSKEPVSMYVSYAKDLLIGIINNAPRDKVAEMDLDSAMSDCIKIIKTARNSFVNGWKI